MDLSQHTTDASIMSAIRQCVADQLGTTLLEAQLVDSSLASRMLDVRLNDLPGLLPRVNVAKTGEKARYRYRLADIRAFIDARKLPPTSRPNQPLKVRISWPPQGFQTGR